MSSFQPKLPEIKDEERTPIVETLLEVIAYLQFGNEELKKQILELKGETTKPDIKPSKMDDDSTPFIYQRTAYS